MSKKIEFGIIGIVIVLAFIVCLMVLLTDDNEGPVIRIDDEVQISYKEGQDKSVLLEGVTAYDKKDGNVTSSIRVESMFVAGDILKVRYAAKDKHNNVTIADRYRDVEYIAEATQEGQENVQNDGTDETDNSNETQNNDNADNTQNAELSEPADNNENVIDATAEIDRAKADETGIPVIRLTENEVTIHVGDDFEPLVYVWETYDDGGDVSRRIRISNDYDTDTVGDYVVTYRVTDEDGNISEPAVLTLHVQGE